jgi:putative ABC transport system ATP-binding protein
MRGFSLISLKDIQFHYQQGDFYLHIQDMNVGAGQKVAVIGPSGSGKTTLLNLIGGILSPTSGNIQVNDQNLTRMNDASRRDFRAFNIGLVFQEFELLEYLNVLDNILLPYRISPALKLDKQVRDRAVQLARDVGIEHYLKRYTHQMSQGQRQRVAICRALLPNPGLLLADEPTGNLDPVSKEHVLEILFECVSRTEATLLAVTHDRSIVDRFDSVIDFKKFQSVNQSDAGKGQNE